MGKNQWRGDPWQNADAKAWMARTAESLPPKIRNSAYVMSLLPDDGEADVKFAVELGFSVMMDKPILAIAKPGTPISEHLRRVADRIVFVDVDSPGGREQAAQEFQAFAKEFGPGAEES